MVAVALESCWNERASALICRNLEPSLPSISRSASTCVPPQVRSTPAYPRRRYPRPAAAELYTASCVPPPPEIGARGQADRVEAAHAAAALCSQEGIPLTAQRRNPTNGEGEEAGIPLPANGRKRESH